MPKLPVVAAVINYNMSKELEQLLPQVLRQNYDEIFVLDDASTDNSREVVNRFKGVKFIAGATNKGAGANRNRIIKALKGDALIHFLDADVDLETENTAQLVRKVAPDKPFGFVSGLIKTRTGQPFPLNYGCGAGFGTSLGSLIQLLTFERRSTFSRLARRMFERILSNWPDPESPPKKREVFWCAEANMVVRSDIFAKFGGFDESFRETEILELAIRLHKDGLKSYFDPTISVRHTEAQVRHYNRDTLKLKELLRISRLLGLRNWLFSDGKSRTKTDS